MSSGIPAWCVVFEPCVGGGIVFAEDRLGYMGSRGGSKDGRRRWLSSGPLLRRGIEEPFVEHVTDERLTPDRFADVLSLAQSANPAEATMRIPGETSEPASVAGGGAGDVEPLASELGALVVEDEPVAEDELVVEDEPVAEDELVVEDEPVAEAEPVVEDDQAADESVPEDLTLAAKVVAVPVPAANPPVLTGGRHRSQEPRKLGILGLPAALRLAAVTARRQR